MSHFPDLLIETYHFLVTAAYKYDKTMVSPLATELLKQAASIKKRMKSLGYHDCWSVDAEIEKALPLSEVKLP